MHFAQQDKRTNHLTRKAIAPAPVGIYPPNQFALP